MNKISYRMIFEGAFDNALSEAVFFSTLSDTDLRRGLLHDRRMMLLRMIYMAYEMDIITYAEDRYLRRAINAIFANSIYGV